MNKIVWNALCVFQGCLRGRTAQFIHPKTFCRNHFESFTLERCTEKPYRFVFKTFPTISPHIRSSIVVINILNVVSVILCHLWKVIWRSICLFTQERALRNVSVPKLNDPQARKLQILFRIGHFVPTWYGKPPTHFEIFSDVWTDLKLLQKQIILALPKEPAKSFPINLFYFNFIFRNQTFAQSPLTL